MRKRHSHEREKLRKRRKMPTVAVHRTWHPIVQYNILITLESQISQSPFCGTKNNALLKPSMIE
jgi:hypothetical protein